MPKILDLKERSVYAFLWGGGASVIKLLIQIVAQVILARLLGPDQYGIFAMGVIVISLCNFLADVGIAYGLIQRKGVSDGHIRYVFTLQIILGSLVSLCVGIFAEPLASFFREPRAEQVLLIMAPICFVQSISAVSINLLKRNLDFKTLQIGQTVGYLIGYIFVGIPLAIAGWQVMALVTAWVVQIILTFIILFYKTRHPCKPLFFHPDAKDMLRFGLKALITNLVNWTISNIDRVVVARVFPSAVVGLYTTPYNLMYTPTSSLMSIVQPVMYSACSRVQGNQAGIGNAYLTVVAAITLFAMPVFFVISVVAETFVVALYGEAWKESADVLMPIALSMPLYMLWNCTTPPLWTNGRPGLECILQVPLALLWFIATLLAAQHSIVAVGWTIFGLIGFRLAIFVVAVCRIAGVSLAAYISAVQGGVVLSIAVASIAWVIDNSGAESNALRLASVIFACAGTLVALLRTQLVYGPLAEMICKYGQRNNGVFTHIARWIFVRERNPR